ncbi:flagellar brake protein [Halobacillus sp. A5]|uniref:flagellar brake protein n=1 Tax=Halobacillus sp. A5 TaxID=2880263 RepID=UPI0020A652AE|nr:flagellar brake domain-containing protein [Halobacillus sp. A5]MCP3025839.1 flagellar brake domain-containing protein [Halobacillus sp. A5]
MFKAGEPLTLELHRNKQEEAEKYKSKIVDFSHSHVFIDYPVKMNTQKTAFFFEGTQFQASFLGEDGSVYWFETEVLARKKKNIPVLMVSFPGEEELVRIQRREYVRVDTAVDVAVNTNNNKTKFTTVTRDLSGGGMAIYEPEKISLSPDLMLDITVVLPMNDGDYHYMESSGKVVRSSMLKGSNKKSVSIEFINLNEKMRQYVIQYCFEQQMQMRKQKRL